MRNIGINSVGMSIVHETIAAYQIGMRVAALSGITNVVGAEANVTTDEEVMEQAELIGPKVNIIVRGLIKELFK